MAETLITLTTDFGFSSPFVAAIKGVLLSINPQVRIVDLSHNIPPFDIRHAAYFLAEAIPFFPPNTIHVVVVDPEVGSDRHVLCVCVAGQRLLVPDNGCWTLLAEGHSQPLRVIRLAEPRFWRPTVSATFHGRDIFAPAAAYLSLGVNPTDLGPITSEWRELRWPTAIRRADSILGEVIFVDTFGNLITNIASKDLPPLSVPVMVRIAGRPEIRRVRTYSDASLHEIVALVSSSGLLEVAEVQGNAAQNLSVGVGASVQIEWRR